MPLSLRDITLSLPDGSVAVWKRSSRSMANGNCVEVAGLPGDVVGVRDSKDGCGPILRFTQPQWGAFIGGVRNGGFDCR